MEKLFAFVPSFSVTLHDPQAEHWVCALLRTETYRGDDGSGGSSFDIPNLPLRSDKSASVVSSFVSSATGRPIPSRSSFRCSTGHSRVS